MKFFSFFIIIFLCFQLSFGIYINDSNMRAHQLMINLIKQNNNNIKLTKINKSNNDIFDPYCMKGNDKYKSKDEFVNFLGFLGDIGKRKQLEYK